jgi:endonuclease YncB( thermonuclease family)
VNPDTPSFKNVALLSLCLACGVVASIARAEARFSDGTELDGVVLEITDGDTLVLGSADGARIRVRLAEIDAPEMSQPYGVESKRALEEFAKDERVRVVVVDTDRYGRTVGEIYLDGVYLNAEMVRQGHAWAYTRYAKSTTIIERENEARKASRGLWALPESERDAPWIWRSERRKGAAPDRAPNVAKGCGVKRTCGEMRSCEEANYYLRECGLTRLDGDRDGIPCEALCGGG